MYAKERRNIMVSQFYTIEEEKIEAEVVEKKSRFIACIMRINSEEEAQEKIKEIKKIHRDAKHHVFAYRIANEKERFSDDGEPSGTAGVPILDILRGENLENVLIVVTRYFGGILLGTGGLVRAYSEAAKEGLKQAQKVQMKLCTEYEIMMEYSYYDILNHYLKSKNIVIKSVEYHEKICLNIIVEKSCEEEILKEINDVVDRNANLKELKTYYYV